MEQHESKEPSLPPSRIWLAAVWLSLTHSVILGLLLVTAWGLLILDGKQTPWKWRDDQGSIDNLAQLIADESIVFLSVLCLLQPVGVYAIRKGRYGRRAAWTTRFYVAGMVALLLIGVLVMLHCDWYGLAHPTRLLEFAGLTAVISLPLIFLGGRSFCLMCRSARSSAADKDAARFVLAKFGGVAVLAIVLTAVHHAISQRGYAVTYLASRGEATGRTWLNSVARAKGIETTAISRSDAQVKPDARLLRSIVGDAFVNGLAGRITYLKTDDTYTDEDWSHVSAQTEMEEIQISDRDSTPADLSVLNDLKALRTVTLWSKTATDEDLAVLANLTELQHLALSADHVTGVAFERLNHLPALRTVELHFRASEEGMAAIAALPHLEAVKVYGTLMDKRWLVQLAKSKTLKKLTIVPQTSRPDWLPELALLSQIEEIDISGEQATNEWIWHLRSLKNLRDLRLTNTGITDRGLAHLVRLQSLELLYIASAYVSREGMKELTRARPELSIMCPGSTTSPILSQEPIEFIIQRLQEGTADERVDAAQTLGECGLAAAQATEALSQALADENTRVRLHAANALADIGPAASAAIPALKNLRNDDNVLVSIAADRALERVQVPAE